MCSGHLNSPGGGLLSSSVSLLFLCPLLTAGSASAMHQSSVALLQLPPWPPSASHICSFSICKHPPGAFHSQILKLHLLKSLGLSPCSQDQAFVLPCLLCAHPNQQPHCVPLRLPAPALPASLLPRLELPSVTSPIHSPNPQPQVVLSPRSPSGLRGMPPPLVTLESSISLMLCGSHSCLFVHWGVCHRTTSLWECSYPLTTWRP